MNKVGKELLFTEKNILLDGEEVDRNWITVWSELKTILKKATKANRIAKYKARAS